jgi:uncharacterized protein (TIGR02145 family)
MRNTELIVTNLLILAYGFMLTSIFAQDNQFRDTTTQVVDVYSPATGRTWMDRNLGASRAATSINDVEAYGHLYQWGRPTDGHQLRTSGSTDVVSQSDFPGHGDFIIVTRRPTDWRSPQNANLWQGIDGINNPCPEGYRLPSAAELDAERRSWGVKGRNAKGAFDSPLRLPLAGARSSADSFFGVDVMGTLWTSTTDGNRSSGMTFGVGMVGAFMDRPGRGLGASVRCIKD